VRPFPVRASLFCNGQPLEICAGPNKSLRILGLPENSPVPLHTVIKLEFNESPQRIVDVDRAAWIKGKLVE
jgi:hypothetical protein